MRKTVKPRRRGSGRRKVEADEFCRNCNRYKHDERIRELTSELYLALATINQVAERFGEEAEVINGVNLSEVLESINEVLNDE